MIISEKSPSASSNLPTSADADTSSDTTRKLVTGLGLLDDAAREHDRDICLTHIQAAQVLVMQVLVALRRAEAGITTSEATGATP